MEPKAKTLQERFGFSDPDLKTPKHDALMLWLDAEMDSVLTQLFGEPIAVWKPVPKVEYYIQRDGNQSVKASSAYDLPYMEKQEEHRAICDKHIQDIKQQIRDELNLPKSPTRIIKKRWETPILDASRNSAYTIGFADMFAIGDVPWVKCNFTATRSINKDYDIKYVNSSIERPSFTNCSPQAYFEVKPIIPSLGELIRQIRMYQTYTASTPWVVVSPDKRFASQLEAQGIQFLEAPSDV